MNFQVENAVCAVGKMHEFQRAERTVISRSHPNWKACHRLCSLSRKLGNCAAYILRHRVFDKLPVMTRKELDTALKEQYASDYRAMPSAASAQRQGQVVAKQFKSYAKALTEYANHPEKFKGKPQLPGYKRRYRSFYVGRNGYQISNGRLTITGAQDVGFEPMPVRCCKEQVFNAKAEDAVVGDVRIVPMGNSFIFELTYTVKQEDVQKNCPLDSRHALIGDLGVNNFAAFVSTKPGVRPVLIKGGVLKSLNQSYNKQTAELRAKKQYRHIRIKGFKRYRQVQDLLHKASRMVINYCLAHDLGTLIIGVNKYWKQEVSMGCKNNQNFVMLPHAVFVGMLKYKAQQYGIEVIEREESYTSRASSLDFDTVPDYGAVSAQPVFSGKRIKRGLYEAADGRRLNADINGAINIGRKELGNEWLQKLLELDGGVVDTPVVIRYLHERQSIGSLLEVGARSYETSRVSAR